jgi:hypothetical protein
MVWRTRCFWLAHLGRPQRDLGGLPAEFLWGGGFPWNCGFGLWDTMATSTDAHYRDYDRVNQTD